MNNISAWGIDHGEPVEKSVLGAFSGLARGTARGFKAGRAAGMTNPMALRQGLGRGLRGAGAQLRNSQPGRMLRKLSGAPRTPAPFRRPT